MTTSPPPGWHRDPEGNDFLRWWDGRQWTSATAASPASQPAPPQNPAVPTADPVSPANATSLSATDPEGVPSDDSHEPESADASAPSKYPRAQNKKILVSVLVVAAVTAVVVGVVSTRGNDEQSDAAAPSPTSTEAVADSPDQIEAAEIACVDALGSRFSTALQPVTILDYKTTVDGENYRTVGTADVFYGTAGSPERYAVVCTGTRVNGAVESEVTSAEKRTSPYSPTATTPPSTPAPTTPPAIAPITPRPLPASCNTPAPSVIALIDAAFIEADQHLEDAFLVYGARDVAYIGANIMDSSGTRLSSADVWAQSDGAIYALSGDARRRTSFPDGRRALDISAGDEFGTAVSDCIQISVINRNASGGN